MCGLKRDLQNNSSLNCERTLGLVSGGSLLSTATSAINALKLGGMASMRLAGLIWQSCKTSIMSSVNCTQSAYTPLSEPIRIALYRATFFLAFKKCLECILCQLRVLSRVTILASIILSCNLASSYAEAPRNSSIQIVNIDVLADAIYRAEGGAKTRHPYGILKKYKTTTPRQACINTIKSNLKRYRASRSTEDFITFMSRSYCPIGAENDPTGLNRHWVKNVTHFYARLLSKSDGAIKSFTKHKAQNVNKRGGKNARL